MAFTAVIVAAAGLAGCGTIDNMLFRGTASGGTSGNAGTLPGGATSAQTSTTGTSGALAPEETGVSANEVSIAEGQATGTAVGQKVQEMRATLKSLQSDLGANAQRLATLRQAEASYGANYQESKAHIIARLQVGTTRGNPELVSEWNTAQSSLDRLAAGINAMNALGSGIANDDSQAHYTLDSIRAAYTISGAVDEDHRQLKVLEDETNEMIVLIERQLTEVSTDVQRQTSYVANERANLTTLANGIKNGEIYGAALGPAMLASAGPSPIAGSAAMVASGGPPLVVIRFDRPNVEYQQILYTALAQALERRPDAAFAVIAVAPTAGTATSVQLAQSETQRNAQAVLRSMGDMGVPSNRLALASTTDPTVTAGEVRVYVR